MRRFLHPQDIRRRSSLLDGGQGVHRAAPRERKEQYVLVISVIDGLSRPRRPQLLLPYPPSLPVNGPSSTVECFIEGSRSRTGKLLPPKLGILKNVLEFVESDPGETRDVWLCPISLQYDTVIEADTYFHELLGSPKEKETCVLRFPSHAFPHTNAFPSPSLYSPPLLTLPLASDLSSPFSPLASLSLPPPSVPRHSLSGLLSNSRIIQLQLGRIDVRFQKPFSLRGWLQDQRSRREQPSNASSVRVPKSDQATVLRALGYEVLAQINDASVIPPVALVGTVLLTIRGRGVRFLSLFVPPFNIPS